MKIEPYMHLVPAIEQKIRDLELDSLVLGLGPTAWLLPWVDRKLLNGLRLWAAHDFFKVMPVDDLWIFDGPGGRLTPGQEAFEVLTRSRPRRLWVFDRHLPYWEPFLHAPVRSVLEPRPLLAIQYGPGWNGVKPEDWPKTPELASTPPHTLYVSPTGMTTHAWAEGCRRIGVLGVDMRQGEHHTAEWRGPVDTFFVTIANQAHALGGIVANLSPITSLEGFRTWTPPSASSSGPTRTSESTEQRPSSNTASGATRGTAMP